MPSSPDRIDPNYPGLDPSLAFKAPADVKLETKQVPAGPYQIVPQDYYRRLAVTAAAATAVTVPAMALADFPVGGLVAIQRFGSGPVSIVGATGVTVRGVSGFTFPVGIAGDQGAVWLMRQDVSTWAAFGDLAKA